MTLHRPANVDGEQQLLGLPKPSRTARRVCRLFFRCIRVPPKICGKPVRRSPLHYVDPLGYLEFNYLVKHARGVITDSGGITQKPPYSGCPA